jgi:2-iminobutanoate/2-iminopropanoate deaminase
LCFGLASRLYFAPSADLHFEICASQSTIGNALPAVNAERSQLRVNMRDVISTTEGPKAIGPYSQAIRANGFVFVSGQVAFDPATNNLVAGDVAVQTDRVLKNLRGILNAAGSSLDKVVRSTVFLKNMNDFAAMNEVYAKHFTAAPPARSTVEVARLPKDVLVEIDVIALA